MFRLVCQSHASSLGHRIVTAGTDEGCLDEAFLALDSYVDVVIIDSKILNGKPQPLGGKRCLNTMNPTKESLWDLLYNTTWNISEIG